jgi:hypothetical protein
MTALASFLAVGVCSEPRSGLTAFGYYDDAIGTLEMGAEYLGAAPRQTMVRARQAQPQRGGGGPRVPRQRLIPDVPGVPAPGLRLQPLGLGSTAFTAASGLLLAIQASPQKPFKPQRLILDITRTGASATGLVTVNRIDIGVDNMLVGSGPLPASMFQNTGVDLNVSFAPATPGINIVVQLACSVAPAGADRVDIAAGMLGTAFGS